MQIILTGASSYIGARTATFLCGAGHAVIATFRTANAYVDALSRLDRSPELVQLDIANADHFARLPGSIDAIVHVAGVSISPEVSLDQMLACNVSGTRNLVTYAQRAGAKRIIHTSTLSVHGRIDEPAVDEATPVRDPDPYGASKHVGERILASVASDIPSVAVRLPGVLGQGAHRAWIPVLKARLKRHEPVTIYTPDAPFNNAAWLDDVAGLLTHLVSRQLEGFQAFPIGAGGMTTVGEVVRKLVAATGSRSTITVGPPRKAGFTISSDFASARYGYQPLDILTILDLYAGL